MCSACAHIVCWETSSLQHQPAFCFLIRFEPTSELWSVWYRCTSERVQQLFDMQQAIACSVWQLQLRLPLIATRRARMNLQPSFVCRPDQNLWQSGPSPRCFVVWYEAEGIQNLVTEQPHYEAEDGNLSDSEASRGQRSAHLLFPPSRDGAHLTFNYNMEKKSRGISNWIDALHFSPH